MQSTYNLTDLIIQNFDRENDNIIIINTDKKEYTFRNFDKLYMEEKIPLTFSEIELECAILFSSKIRLNEISQVLSLSKQDINNIFKSIRNKIPKLKNASTKFISNHI